MRASKECCDDALKTLQSLRESIEANKRLGRDSKLAFAAYLNEIEEMLTLFRRRLPTEESYERERQRRRKKPQLAGV